jgi:hypothetical protein
MSQTCISGTTGGALKANHRSPISAGGRKGRNVSRSVAIRQLVKDYGFAMTYDVTEFFTGLFCGVLSVLLCLLVRCSGGGGVLPRPPGGQANYQCKRWRIWGVLKSESGQKIGKKICSEV